jgi:DNA adenine methylase
LARKNPCKRRDLERIIEQKVKEALEKKAEEAQTAISPSLLYAWSPSMLSNCDLVKPPLKWVGGKTQILNEVIKNTPRRIKNYYEPFLGGGSVLLAVLSHAKATNMTIEGKVVAGDANENVIALYKNIQHSLPALLAQLATFTSIFSKCPAVEGGNREPTSTTDAMTSKESYYYWIRKAFNEIQGEDRKSPAASAMFLFLNKTGFRGVYREGPHGYNVPFGHYKNAGIYEEAHLRSVSELLASRQVEFIHTPFTQFFQTYKPKRGDFVYLDPPYAPADTKSFVSYNKSGFKEADHKALFEACHTLRTNGVSFLLSNSDVDMVTKEFPEADYDTQVLSCRRAIHSTDPSQRANELLIRPLTSSAAPAPAPAPLNPPEEALAQGQ